MIDTKIDRCRQTHRQASQRVETPDGGVIDAAHVVEVADMLQVGVLFQALVDFLEAHVLVLPDVVVGEVLDVVLRHVLQEGNAGVDGVAVPLQLIALCQQTLAVLLPRVHWRRHVLVDGRQDGQQNVVRVVPRPLVEPLERLAHLYICIHIHIKIDR